MSEDDYEDEFRGIERKEERKERRSASQRDRSQFKKTDLDKRVSRDELHRNIKLEKSDLARGRVVSVVSQSVNVHYNGVAYTCVVRGLLKRDRTQEKNLIAVGDWVLFERTAEGEGTIHHRETRKSVLSRADNLDRRREQVISANVDQVLITASVVDPPLKPFLIDRYIIAAGLGNMVPVVIINKVDLLEDSEDPFFEEAVVAYGIAGIPVVQVSADSGTGLDDLRKQMQNKTSVFSGQSGVGKSSLINAILGTDLRIGETVKKTKKGSHTTTHSQLIPLDFGGWCVDTPGIKSFGLWDLKKEDIEGYYSEIHEIGCKCKFSTCSHLHEPECAVMEAVENEEISFLRYESYRQLVETIDLEHKRR